MNKRTPRKPQNGQQHIRRDTRLTKAALTLDRILKQNGEVAKRIKAEWPAWELWRFRRGHRRPGLEGSLTMKRVSRGQIQPEHWTELAEVSSTESSDETGAEAQNLATGQS